MQNFITKINYSLIITIVFYLLYSTIPNYEFDGISKKESKLDRIYYTITTQTGFRTFDSIRPLSKRAKILTLVHIVMAYSILLLK